MLALTLIIIINYELIKVKLGLELRLGIRDFDTSFISYLQGYHSMLTHVLIMLINKS